jgi:hypothetical protein
MSTPTTFTCAGCGSTTFEESLIEDADSGCRRLARGHKSPTNDDTPGHKGPMNG